MTVGTGGVEYENKVLSAVKSKLKSLPKCKLKEGSSTAAFAATEPDLVLIYDGVQINIEIKQDTKAQMGGGSYNYNMKTKKFSLSAKTVIDPSIDKKLKEELDARASSLNKLLTYARDNGPKALSESVTGLPLKSSKKTWEAMTKNKLLVPLNAKIQVPYTFLHDHYAKKDCYYIQIGGAGLFYLKENPLNLPIPQLTLPMAIELRLGRAGSKMDKSLKMEVASGNMRAQGRLDSKGTVKSPYTLDSADHFYQLFGKLEYMLRL